MKKLLTFSALAVLAGAVACSNTNAPELQAPGAASMDGNGFGSGDSEGGNGFGSGDVTTSATDTASRGNGFGSGH